MKETIIVEAKVNALIEKIWDCWTLSHHIVKWNSASEDWHTTFAQNNLTVGGKFNFRMEAKDKSQGFDFTGTYTVVEENKEIEYTMDDGRKVRVEFAKEADGYKITETFDVEHENTPEFQRAGWQAILDNFKKYVEFAN